MNVLQEQVRQTASVMLKIGCLGFGGPAAHIAMLEDEVVERRQWMSRDHFVDLVGATNLIPGPNSTEMMMHVGFERHGWKGLLLAGALFVLPAALITGIWAWLYVSFGSRPEATPLLAGIKPAIVVVIAGAVWRLGHQALKGWRQAMLGTSIAVAVVLGVDEISALILGVTLGMIWFWAQRLGANSLGVLWLASNPMATGPSVRGALPTELTEISLAGLALVFVKAGALLYGSGYVLFAFLHGDLVERLGWMGSEQLLDAIAIGQMTPGPVLSAATFVGYSLLGVPGAVVATLAIFLPSVLFVGILNPMVPRLRDRSSTAAFLDAVNTAAVGLMAAVVVQLGAVVLLDWKSWSIAALAAIALFRWRLAAVWVIVGGGVLGAMLQWMSST